MMKRYFVLATMDGYVARLTGLLAEAPPNSVEDSGVVEFVKPIFNRYPNPTSVFEGAERYYVQKEEGSYVAALTELLDVMPENAVLYTGQQFVLPVFDCWPAPSAVLEGAEKYFTHKGPGLETQIELLPGPPVDGILWFPNNFAKPVFNQFPNPTAVIEGGLRYFLLKDAQTNEVYVSNFLAEAPENSVPFVPNEFEKPVFDQYPNPVSVIEGQTSEVVAARRTAQYMERLQLTASSLRDRAKAAAIDKTGERSYIYSQVELYELKYKVALGTVSNEYMTELLENEAQEFGVQYEAFCELIIWMYESAKSKYEVFLLMIERCRTKIQTLIEQQNWLAVDQAFAFVDGLQTQEQAAAVMTSILQL